MVSEAAEGSEGSELSDRSDWAEGSELSELSEGAELSEKSVRSVKSVGSQYLKLPPEGRPEVHKESARLPQWEGARLSLFQGFIYSPSRSEGKIIWTTPNFPE